MNQNLAPLAMQVTDALLAAGGQLKGAEIIFKCLQPGHEDEHPSARWNPAKGVFFCDPCGSGGGTVALAQRLGVSEMKSSASPARSSGQSCVAQYRYTDSTGKALFLICRFEPGANGRKKDFRQYHACPSAEKGWQLGLGGDPARCSCPRVSRVLYNLTDLLDPSRQTEWVFIAEGEKCATYLSEPGLLATTAPGGAGKWKPDAAGIELAKPLVGRRIVILPDNDEAGRKHAEAVARTLRQVGATEVRMLELPNLPPKGDVVDWMEASRDEDKVGTIRRLAEAAPVWNPSDPLPATTPHGELLGDERFTDTGNAKRLVARHGADLRFCFPWGRWLVWDGKRWRIDMGDRVMLLAIDTARSIFAEAAVSKDSEEAEDLAKHAMKSLSASWLRALVDLARCYLPADPASLDSDPWLFNVENGTLDLRTGMLREHSREDRLTKLAPVAFDPTATCPTWDLFLRRIFGEKEALIAYLGRSIGYALTGQVREQVLFFLHGNGANGKSTLLEALLATLGTDYAVQAAPNLLISKQSDAHPTEVADLFGKRFVATVEVGDGRRMAEALVKQLTGGDTVKARRMREDFWSFSPTHKLFLAANHKPVVTGTDHAIWRRFQLIPFDVTIPESEQDKGLPEKLHAERSGILAWAVRGCLEWQRIGLAPPPEVLGATKDYREEMDSVGDFIADRCTLAPNLRASASALFNAYLSWHGLAEGGEALTPTSFGRRLQERGFRKARTGTGRFWVGLGLDSLPLPVREPGEEG